MEQQRSLIRFATDAEDVASGLHTFRDRLPRSATRITATISELFALSSILREIDNVEGDHHYSASFYRVQDDLKIVYPTLRRTLDAVFTMFARSRERQHQMIWEDLSYKMEREEGFGLLERLELYHEFLRAQSDILQGRAPADLTDVRREIRFLANAQEVSVLRAERLTVDTTATSTPRPPPMRPRPRRIDTPISPTSTAGSWSDYIAAGRPPPFAPEPPTSPTYTSSSSHTLPSSQTSYSSDQAGTSTRLVHWAQDIFDGRNPCTSFKEEYQLDDPFECQGTVDPSSLRHLARDGFVPALELPFDRDRALLRLYFRPSDSRCRIWISTKDSNSRESHYCTPLTNLKIIRNASTLQLCRAKGEGSYSLWARLNFYRYERMVLFYCTFVAMKRQDSRPVPHDDLMDDFELEEGENGENGEIQEFGGKIVDGDLQHALRLYRDRSSGVVRLEASALRGPMQDVPLWTAFVTKYARDPDWPEYEGGGVVSCAAMRPPPYVFLSGYEPPRDNKGQIILQFLTSRDAQDFVETWAGLCRASDR